MSESRTPMTDSTIVRSKIHGVELEAVPVGFARRLELALAQAEEALCAIAGGYTDKLVDAPDPMTASSALAFRADMWAASQKAADAALAAIEKLRSA